MATSKRKLPAMAFRLTVEAKRIIAKQAKKQGLTQTAVIEQALRAYEELKG